MRFLSNPVRDDLISGANPVCLQNFCVGGVPASLHRERHSVRYVPPLPSHLDSDSGSAIRHFSASFASFEVEFEVPFERSFEFGCEFGVESEFEVSVGVAEIQRSD